MLYELDCRYDTRQSFYGKAQVQVAKNSIEEVQNLYSYGTLVANIITNFEKGTRKYEYMGQYSATTTRHQKEFFKQNGLNDKEIKELFKNDRLEKEC